MLFIRLISLVILVNESDFSPPSPGAYAFLTSGSVHVPLDSVFNQIW